MPTTPASSQSAVGEPFPLQRYYATRVIPGIIVFLAVLSALLWLAFSYVTQHIYMEEVQGRTDVIVKAVRQAEPDLWQRFIAGEILNETDHQRIDELLYGQLQLHNLLSLKVYDLRGQVLYDIRPGMIGTIETSQPLRDTIVTGQPHLLYQMTDSGTPAYEVYTPYMVDGNMRAVTELYEEVGYLDTMLYETAIPAIAVPVALQIVLIMVLGFMVRRAQRDIDQRTQAITELSKRLETFVSASAIDAAKTASALDAIPSRKVECTLFHSDIRDFTSYAEDNTPERVVYFLNDVMSIQVEAVTNHGGDVDKMIGDALLVRFEGDNAERRAIDAARDILDAVKRAGLARGIGIGIYTGQVISGAIGPQARRDFTVIGDSVNMSARLCSQAHGGEIVADAATVTAAADQGFSPVEHVQVKGRSEPLAVQRWQVNALADTPKA